MMTIDSAPIGQGVWTAHFSYLKTTKWWLSNWMSSAPVGQGVRTAHFSYLYSVYFWQAVFLVRILLKPNNKVHFAGKVSEAKDDSCACLGLASCMFALQCSISKKHKMLCSNAYNQKIVIRKMLQEENAQFKPHRSALQKQEAISHSNENTKK